MRNKNAGFESLPNINMLSADVIELALVEPGACIMMNESAVILVMLSAMLD